jgi:hypothetical protein
MYIYIYIYIYICTHKHRCEICCTASSNTYIPTYRGEYSFVGCCTASYNTSFVMGRLNGSWGWANDGELRAEGLWCGKDAGLRSYRVNDVVGVLIDTDLRTMQFTKNGTLLPKTVRRVCVCVCVCVYEQTMLIDAKLKAM